MYSYTCIFYDINIICQDNHVLCKKNKNKNVQEMCRKFRGVSCNSIYKYKHGECPRKITNKHGDCPC